jgi:hypothetical protein
MQLDVEQHRNYFEYVRETETNSQELVYLNMYLKKVVQYFQLHREQHHLDFVVLL